MSQDKNPAANGHAEDPIDSELENFGDEPVEKNDVAAKVATIAVVGVGAALISAELIPGIIIGVAACLLPGIGPKLKPLFKSTVRAGYSAVRKTREMVAEAHEQVKDVVAEARADHEAEAKGAGASTGD
jgi:hypothetical protein